MHPHEFFDKCNIKVSQDVFEIYDDEMKEKLKNIHPKNFLRNKITLPVFKISLSYCTDKNNYKRTDRYVIMDKAEDEEYVDLWVDIFVRDYNKDNPNHKMIDCFVDNIEMICEAVLPIG